MIAAVTRKEFAQRRGLFTIAFALVVLVTASIPFVFTYSLHRAFVAVRSDTTALVLANFRSYPVFVESDWLARNLTRILCLLGLIAGAGAIAGEREARTMPLLFASSVRLRAVVLVKFAFVAAWLALVTVASVGVLEALSLSQRMALPVEDVVVSAAVGLANAYAFLGVVFAGSAYVKRTVCAVGMGLCGGIAVAAALAPFGLNGTALATNVVATDGRLVWPHVAVDVAASGGIMAAGLALALFEVSRRRAL